MEAAITGTYFAVQAIKAVPVSGKIGWFSLFLVKIKS